LASTFDVLTAEGTYVGGVIAPGVYLSLAALQQAAAKLPSIRVREPDSIVGRHTVAAMESGIYYGYVSMIEGVLTRIRRDYPAIKKVIATGGLAPLYARHVHDITDTISDLTIYGLIRLYRLNAQPAQADTIIKTT
jgi:type III pantothenate kinase